MYPFRALAQPREQEELRELLKATEYGNDYAGPYFGLDMPVDEYSSSEVPVPFGCDRKTFSLTLNAERYTYPSMTRLEKKIAALAELE